MPPVIATRQTSHFRLYTRLPALLIVVWLINVAGLQAGEITFVRHGETVANATGSYKTATVNRLTDRGKAHATQLTGLLDQGRFTLIAVSPAERCQLTILPYLSAHQLSAQIWPELHEVSNRVLRTPGSPRPPQRAGAIRIEPNKKRYFVLPSVGEHACYFQPQTLGEANAQAEMAATRLRHLARQPNARILVIGHSLMGSRILELLLGRPTLGQLVLENGAINRIVVDHSGKARLVMQNNQPKK